MQKETLGLRERQRLERLEALHNAAFELCATDGLSRTTVEAIADQAGLSRRTFFNYYASKEEAILGLMPVTVPEDARVAYFNDDAQPDNLRRTIDLLLAVVRASHIGEEGKKRRRKLIEAHPELAQRQREHLKEAQELVLAVMAESSDNPTEDLEQDQLTVLIAGVAIRATFVSNKSRAIDDITDERIETAISRIRDVMKEV